MGSIPTFFSTVIWVLPSWATIVVAFPLFGFMGGALRVYLALSIYLVLFGDSLHFCPMAHGRLTLSGRKAGVRRLDLIAIVG